MSYVLIVDDEQYICWLVEETLAPLGYMVRTATNREKALSLIRQEPPGLILLDLKLPQVSGTALLEEIRHLAPEVPVVLMTGEVEAAENLPVAGRLAKPFNLQDLRRLVETLLPFLPERP